MIRHPAGGSPTGWGVVYAPGAGSNLNDAFGRRLCEDCAAAGIDAYRFQFLYMEQNRKSPDRAPALEAAWRSVIAAVRPAVERLAVGGRSMGGRYASIVTALGAPVEALGLFAYPLHAPGDDRWRAGHFGELKVPAFFCSGTNDAFATPDELRSAMAGVPHATIHFLDGADHGFSVPRASGRTRLRVYEEAVRSFLDWLTSL